MLFLKIHRIAKIRIMATIVDQLNKKLFSIPKIQLNRGEVTELKWVITIDISSKYCLIFYSYMKAKSLKLIKIIYISYSNCIY